MLSTHAVFGNGYLKMLYCFHCVLKSSHCLQQFLARRHFAMNNCISNAKQRIDEGKPGETKVRADGWPDQLAIVCCTKTGGGLTPYHLQ